MLLEQSAETRTHFSRTGVSPPADPTPWPAPTAFRRSSSGAARWSAGLPPHGSRARAFAPCTPSTAVSSSWPSGNEAFFRMMMRALLLGRRSARTRTVYVRELGSSPCPKPIKTYWAIYDRIQQRRLRHVGRRFSRAGSDILVDEMVDADPLLGFTHLQSDSRSRSISGGEKRDRVLRAPGRPAHGENDPKRPIAAHGDQQAGHFDAVFTLGRDSAGAGHRPER